ncbi:hypothetical protein CBR_g23782 [Chara braunii]|uniref:CAAX prenyl protease n=1 Tax=Chara braunii TaxID=69332 RepID=A0A388JVJ1_CHABU|nr:hypothetical protein CBR_g23782 [Chara braunii]|eukprot:GBG61826.1 hypothetical protein CBR_g23782 [Chara braunii]
MEAVVTFMVVMYFFETYLDFRQHKALKSEKLPRALVGVVSHEKFLKARAYSLEKSRFGFVQGAVVFSENIAILLLKLLPWLWDYSGTLVFKLGFDPENEILHSLALLAVTTVWAQVLGLPFSIYSTFVIEERHGFNKQTPWLFVKDVLMELLLAAILGPPVITAVITIVNKGGPYFPLYLWAFIVLFSLLMMTIFPILIAPLFNKYTPLPEGTLRTKIENLASSLKFPLKKIFVVDGSKRSSHSNAYMYGFFNNKRIVLYDTLIAQCNDESEVVATLAHELGHWKLSHTVYNLCISQILALVQCAGYAVVRNSRALFESFGFSVQPVVIGFMLYEHIITPVHHLVSFAMNLLSRSFEFQADAFAKKLGYGSQLRGALIKMQEENLSTMNTDPWYSAYHYSHPPLVDRLSALGKVEDEHRDEDITSAGGELKKDK